MSRPYVSAITPRDAIEVFGNLSQNNHYQVSFNALPPAVEEHIARKFTVYDSNYWMGSKGGIMCSSASLPGTNLAMTDVKDNFMGIPQQFAHTRQYTDAEFTFYVDRDYTNLRVFEGWIDYISSGSEDNIDELSANYYRRMRYPNTYKSSTMYITKFEKDIDEGGKRIDYLFVNAFPRAVIPVPVAYGNAEILQVTVQFVYDRYIMNPKGRMGGYKKPVEENFGTFRSVELKKQVNDKNTSLSPKPVATTPSIPPNTGTGRDGSFGSGTTGQGLPSNPNLRSVTSEAEIRDKRTYGNSVPEGSFNITPKVPIRNRRGRIIGYK